MAMTARPNLISGEARSDLRLKNAGRHYWVVKIDANAVHKSACGRPASASPPRSRAAPGATAHVDVPLLDQLGLLDAHIHAGLQVQQEANSVF
jgi:hypothetical protein